MRRKIHIYILYTCSGMSTAFVCWKWDVSGSVIVVLGFIKLKWQQK